MALGQLKRHSYVIPWYPRETLPQHTEMTRLCLCPVCLRVRRSIVEQMVLRKTAAAPAYDRRGCIMDQGNLPVKPVSRSCELYLAADGELKSAGKSGDTQTQTVYSDRMGCLCCEKLTQEPWLVFGDHPVHKDWEVLRELSRGGSARVWSYRPSVEVLLARNRHDPAQLAALKVVYLLRPDLAEQPEWVSDLEREASLLQSVESPHVVRCFDKVSNDRQCVFVLEFLAGGELLNELVSIHSRNYTEQHAVALFQQVMEGVSAIHGAGILHRDIKPENIMFKNPVVGHNSVEPHAETPLLVIIDFGIAIRYDINAPFSTGILGSPGFVAPEAVLGRVHTPAMDVFSAGVLLFIMLVGRKPFNVQQSTDLSYAELTLEAAPGFQDPRWQGLSALAQDLVLSMLCFDVDKRLSAQQVLRHKWVSTRAGAQLQPLASSVATGTANVAALRRLRNLVHAVVTTENLAMQYAQQVPAYCRKRYQQKHKADIQQMRHTFNMTGTPGSWVENLTDRTRQRLAAVQYKRLHDAGKTSDPRLDCSRSCTISSFPIDWDCC